jgi:Protein of unknown function (DUF3826)
MTRALLVYLSAKSLLNRERFSVLNRLVKGYHYFLLLITLFILSAGSLFSQEGPDAYIKTITDRSVKIVNSLSIKDSVVYNKVVAQLVAQYSGLNKIQEENKALMIAIKQSTATTDTSAVLLKNAEEKKSADLKALHQSFISGLRQKTKIYEWLKEAREIAMDAESSDKKHAVFGKYKGRINNYLSAEGYDLKKATEEWQQRIKERNKPAQS